MNRCGSFPLLSAPHFLFSIWTNIERPEKILGAPLWRCREWIWLTGPLCVHRNSPHGLNISFINVFWPYQRSGNPNHPSLPYLIKGVTNQSIMVSIKLFRLEELSKFWEPLCFSQSSYPAARVRFRTGSDILFSILRLDVCPLYSVLCYLWRRSWHSVHHKFR